MEFLIINKSVNPPKVAKVHAASIEELHKSMVSAEITDFVAYLNVTDSSLSGLFSKIDALEARIFKLETNPSLPGRNPAVFAIDESDVHTISGEAMPENQQQKKASPVTVSLAKKTFIPTNARAGILESKIAFSIDIRNKTSKVIRAVKGDLMFSDLFGADIFTVSVTVNNKIRPQETSRWEGEMVYNEFIPAHVHFASFNVEDLKMRIENENVVYG